MSKVKTYVALGYLAISLFVCAILTGEIYRNEIPLWILAGIDREAGKAGSGPVDVILTAVLYLVYYSSLFSLPYVLLAVLLQNTPVRLKTYARALGAVTAAWLALTFVLYREAIFSIMRTMSLNTASEWLGLLWVALALLVLFLWWNYVRSMNKDSV